MKQARVFGMALGLVALVLCGFLAPVSAGSTRGPTLLADGPHWRLTWQVRPANIVYTGDGSGVLGGFDGNGPAHPGDLTWNSWTPKKATASGAVWLDDCAPSCAAGSFTPRSVKVTAFRPVGGHFTRLTMRFSYHDKLYIDRRGIRHTDGSWSYYLVGRSAA